MEKLLQAQRLRGFSLVELLIVLTIVATLVALLIPSIGQAREVARRSVCMSQYHQIGVGAAAYNADHKDEVPYLNNGNYAVLGKGGAYCQSWETKATGQARIKADPLCIFAEYYLNSPFYMGPSSLGANTVYCPKVMVCPGIDRSRMVMELPPGQNNPATTTQLGNGVVGFGSFLGQATGGTPGTAMANGVLNMRNRYSSTTGANFRLRMMDIRNPADDVIFLDLQNQRTSLTSLWMITHGRGRKPDGTVQGQADFSVSFIPWERINVAFTPGYNWDREVQTPYYASPRAQLNRGGYPKAYGSNGSSTLTTPDWFGIGTFFHTAAFTP